MTLVSAPTETMRALLERIQSRHGEALSQQSDYLTYSDAVAALAILDNAEADMFDESVGMVSLIPDGTVWRLTSKGWSRTPEVLPPPPAKTPQEEANHA